MNAVKQFNGLNGTVVTREELSKLIELAKNQEQTEVVERLEPVLSKFDHETFQVDLQRAAIECVPASLLPLLDEAPELPEEEHGLGKAVSPDDIYTMITNKMIDFIKQANKSDYKKKWQGQVYGTGYLIPFNFESKKRYRGINAYMLRDFDKPLENPFYLTFKQVEKLGGKVKKGTTGHEVVYFTQLYTYSQKEPALDFGTYDKKKFKSWFEKHKHLIPVGEHQKEHSIPILKYYNVFNGKDIEDIDFDLENFKVGYINKELPADEPMPIADAIVENFPAPKVPINHGGDKAAYYPGADHIKMPHKADFETAQDYYRTLFHELGHATGNQKRLSRDLGGKFGSKKYAFEELIAELNAVFVSAEAGFMWHTNKNHAGYLKGWNSVLTHIQDDNRFVMRAATQGQKAADFILQPDADGNPAYMKKLKVDTEKPKVEPKTKKSVTKKVKSVTKPEKVGYMLVDNVTAETIATKKTLPELKNVFQKLEKQKGFRDMEPLVYEIVKKGSKNIPGEKIKVDWARPKKKSKSELEKANPKGFSKKPKSIAFTTAIKDVLSLPKHKGKINERQAAILYKHFKDSAFGSEIFSDVSSDYERGILKKENELYDFAISNDQLEITEFGMEFIQAINARRESLLNQKNNLSLFEGLKGKSPAKKPTKRKPKKATPKKKKSKGLKSPASPFRKKDGLLERLQDEGKIEPTEPQPEPKINITPEPAATAQHIDGGDQSAPAVPVKNNKVRNMATPPTTGKAQFYTVAGEVGKFLQAVERKPKESVVITLDGEQGAGKTTTLYQFMDAFAKGGNRGIFFSLEEHHESSLAQDKANNHLSDESQKLIDIVSDIDNEQEFYNLVDSYDIIFIDSWQKLQRMIGAIRLDEDLRKKFDGKVFVIIFQQTTTGRTKGGAEVVFDGDIIIKMVKEATFDENYAYFDKNRYTKIALENLRYNIATGKVYNPNATAEPETQEPVEVEEIPGFSITEV